MSKMGDMTPEEKRELYARLDELKPLPSKVDEVISAITKMQISILSIYGDPAAPGSRGMIHELQSDVKSLKANELARLSRMVDEQDVKIKALDSLKEKATGYLIGTAVGSGVTGGGIGIIISKLIGV